MAKYSSGQYKVINEKKYIGKNIDRITFRSSWEYQFMIMLDSHPNVLYWASESIQIPYYNAFTKRNTIYVPDFLIVYDDKNGKQHAELIEVKPEKEALLEKAKSKRDQLALALNMMKWEAARAYCAKNGIIFRVLTERQLFGNGK